MDFVNKISRKLKAFILAVQSNKEKAYRPAYRVIGIEEKEQDDYVVVIQMIGKNSTFKMKPEEILADDKMTDFFSPRDVRTLTYLGYLDINSPQYRILAQRLSENNNRVIFCVHKRGSKKAETKTADMISKEEIEKMPQRDAHLVGYALANEAVFAEAEEKKRALRELERSKQEQLAGGGETR